MYYKKDRRGARDYCLFVMVVEMERLVGVVATVKHSCITFNECRKLNIKNPLFT